MCNEMSKAERIARFVKKHGIVDQSYFPECWLTWKAKKDGSYYYKFYNTKTGEVVDKGFDWMLLSADGSVSNCWYAASKTDKICLGKYSGIKGKPKQIMNAGSACDYAYFKYDEELEVMVFAVVYMDTHRYDRKITQEENIRKWAIDNYWSVLFFFKGDKTPYNEDGTPASVFSYGEKGWRCPYSKFTNYYFKEWLKHFKTLEIIKQSAIDFEKFARGTLYGACGRALNPAHTNHIADWFNKPESKKVNKGKIGKIIDDLCNREYKDLQRFAEETRYNIHTNDIIYVDLDVDEDWAVLRYLYRKNDNFLDESYRVFVHEDGRCLMAKKNGPDDWSHATNIDLGWNHSQGRIVNYEAMKKHKRLSYIADMLEKCWEPQARLGKLIVILKNPVIEQLYKSGYPKLCRLLTCENKVANNIVKQFGECNLKESSLYAKLGANKYQLDTVEGLLEDSGNYSYSYYSNKGYRAIADMKAITRMNNISSMDNESFKELLEIVAILRKNTSRSIEESFNLPDSLNLSHAQTINFWKKMARIGIKHIPIQTTYNYRYGREEPDTGLDVVATLIKDTLQNYNMLPLELAPPLPLNEVSSVEELTRLHDNISRYVTEKRLEIKDVKNREKEAKMAKIDEKRRVLEYEDDKYSITLPEKLSDIILEGQKLSHCVGGYTDNHATGFTTILFLRKKESPKESFYTIEVRGGEKDRRVKQIHGKHNKWLGNNPEVVPFVMRWLRDKGVFCEDAILLSTSNSYSNYNAAMIKKPEI